MRFVPIRIRGELNGRDWALSCGNGKIEVKTEIEAISGSAAGYPALLAAGSPSVWSHLSIRHLARIACPAQGSKLKAQGPICSHATKSHIPWTRPIPSELSAVSG